MTSAHVQSIILAELDGNLDNINLHGTTPRSALVQPYQEDYLSFDGSKVFKYWTVLREQDDNDGYTIYFDEERGLFGLGMRDQSGMAMDIGAHGTFMDTFLGM